jgi:tRNA pseudouridine55 synthase
VFGLLNINKPSSLTSRDAVNHVQRIVKPTKVGHAGTLDPLAEGVLIVTVGPATRLTQYVQQMPKVYRASFVFGRQSDTEDVQGRITEVTDAPRIERADLEAVLPHFRGEILQRPPAYSAIKVRGQRAYRLAREGQEVSLTARPVRIDSLTVESFQYPEWTMQIRCGSGTYIRSLGRDIAEALGTAAVMSALTRTAIGHLTIDESITLAVLTPETIEQHLLSPLEAVAHLHQIQVTPSEQRRLANGLAIDRPDLQAVEVVALTSDRRLLAVLRRRGRGRYGPLRNFPVH